MREAEDRKRRTAMARLERADGNARAGSRSQITELILFKIRTLTLAPHSHHHTLLFAPRTLVLLIGPVHIIDAPAV